MFKFLLISTLLIIAQAYEYDYDYPKEMIIAMFPRLQGVSMSCSPLHIKRAIDVQCTCGDRNDVPLFSLKYGPETGDGSEELIALDIVINYSEVAPKLKIENCTCGTEVYEHSVFREIDNDISIYYTRAISPDEPNTAYINVKELPTKDEFEKKVLSQPEFSNRTNYELFCDLS